MTVATFLGKRENQRDAFNYLGNAAISAVPPSSRSMSEPSMSLIPDDPWENSTLPATPSVDEVLLLGWQDNTELRLLTKPFRSSSMSSTSGGGDPKDRGVFKGM